MALDFPLKVLPWGMKMEDVVFEIFLFVFNCLYNNSNVLLTKSVNLEPGLVAFYHISNL